MSRQLDLFGAPPAPGRRGVGPSPISADLAEIARRLPGKIRLGTSSWSFPGWEGIVYDRRATPARLARQGLGAYAKHPVLRAVGVDRTYYAPLPASALAEYAAVVPEEFRFLVKASSECTTPWQREAKGVRNERFLDASYAREHVVEPYVKGLGDRAGALVFQFPPLGAALTREPARFAERLGRFLQALPRGPLYAVEIRDRELLGTAYADALRAVGTRHCLTIHPRMPGVEEQRRLAGENADGPLVVRWMLHAGLGYEAARARYEPFASLVDEDPVTREALAEACLDRARLGHTVILTANNKAEGSAPLTVFKLAEEIVRKLPAEQTAD